MRVRPQLNPTRITRLPSCSRASTPSTAARGRDADQGPNARQLGDGVGSVLRDSRQRELTERRAFIETFVKEIVVMPGDALLRYTIPMPDDSQIPGRNAEEMALNGSVLSTVKMVGLIGR